ncbi:polysaccharide deacetylase family protein [Streptomyces sp. NPDC101149]|uniref:polysaccharide deacetylase family protein n=1 Tax=Streptomyces sp. NPDC101149 TaxID=3366113 RepID=UPI0038059CB1
MRARPWPRALLAGTLAAVLLSGCAQSVDPIERLGKKAAQKVQRSDRAYRRWGLSAPLAPAPRPARPAGGPVRTGGGLPPVLDRVPTHDRVVFLTYDEDVEADPRFVDMVRELRLPVSVFLTADGAGPTGADAARLRAAGAAVQNHALGHAVLRGRPYGEQHAEICGQRDRLTARPGPGPRLLRPPHGVYDRTTLRAAADCGVTAVVLWRPVPERFGAGAPLHPGDIVRPCGTGRPLASPTAETARLLRRIQASGFTVARLEDYL